MVDLIKRGVLTLVGEVRRYRNNRCYYYVIIIIIYVFEPSSSSSFREAGRERYATCDQKRLLNGRIKQLHHPELAIIILL